MCDEDRTVGEQEEWRSLLESLVSPPCWALDMYLKMETECASRVWLCHPCIDEKAAAHRFEVTSPQSLSL